MGDRSRREKQSKLDKLAEYKNARAGGKRVLKVNQYSLAFTVLTVWFTAFRKKIPDFMMN